MISIIMLEESHLKNLNYYGFITYDDPPARTQTHTHHGTLLAGQVSSLNLLALVN